MNSRGVQVFFCSAGSIIRYYCCMEYRFIIPRSPVSNAGRFHLLTFLVLFQSLSSSRLRETTHGGGAQMKTGVYFISRSTKPFPPAPATKKWHKTHPIPSHPIPSHFIPFHSNRDGKNRIGSYIGLHSLARQHC